MVRWKLLQIVIYSPRYNFSIPLVLQQVTYSVLWFMLIPMPVVQEQLN